MSVSITDADVLEEHEPALEAGAGVDVLGRQGGERAVGVAEVPHEHEVPELDVAVAAAVGGPALVAPLRAAVVVDLGARTAGAGLAHLPEVVLVEALDPLHRDPDLLVPDRLGGVVGEVDGGPDAVAVEPGRQHQLPRPLDGLELVVVAEAPVAEHLEEGEVAAGAADLVDVVVLAGQPDALLDRRRPRRVERHRLFAEEVRDELHHPRVREHRARWGGWGCRLADGTSVCPRSAKNSFQRSAKGDRVHDRSSLPAVPPQDWRRFGAQERVRSASARSSASRSRIASRPSATATRMSVPKPLTAPVRSADTRSGA